MNESSDSRIHLPLLTPEDFSSGLDVRWCPGCGDYSIMANIKKVLPTLEIPKENIVFISGIGCSSRFPYYMDTYGMHTIHGRAPTIATGLKCSRPELSVWVITGDGDGLSIGGNHLMHAIRRNVDIKIIVFNNQIYGLTKGQYSPTSEKGKRTKSSPSGSVDYPVNPISWALGAEATFIARTVYQYGDHMQDVLTRAAKHKGTAFVEIYQNCLIFNDGAFKYATDKEMRYDHVLELNHGKPMVFGRDREKGIFLHGLTPKVINFKEAGFEESDLLYHDEYATEPTLAFFLSRMRYPQFPEPIGIFRAIEKETYNEMLNQQIKEAKKKTTKSLQEILYEGETWIVKQD
ncbi:MAG: 2-oxoacid:ferredoxin oxidoreductase subunit beta [Candidatus Hermodarchaeota archaeon]